MENGMISLHISIHANRYIAEGPCLLRSHHTESGRYANVIFKDKFPTKNFTVG